MSDNLIHDLYLQRNLAKFRALVSASGSSQAQNSKKDGGGNIGSHGNSSSVGQGGSFRSSSYSKSPRFDSTGFSHQPAKETVNARDRLGRTVLHLAASTISWSSEKEQTATPLDFLEALLSCPSINVNLQDRENGWTALHKALYAGNLAAAKRLLLHPNIETGIRDIEGLTAFDLLNSTIDGTNPEDVFDDIPIEEQQNPRRELVTWGSNRNFVLGLQGDNDKLFPERVPLQRYATKASRETGEELKNAFEPLRVQKVVMHKMHSALVTTESSNNFRLCGSGSTTGRLALSTPHPQYSFEPVKELSQQKVVDIVLTMDHNVVLTDKGEVWTWGSDSFNALGYLVQTSSYPVKDGPIGVQFTPKKVQSYLKNEVVLGIAASRYHTVAYTVDDIYTWGRNNGQLGYDARATPFQPTPRKVSHNTPTISSITASEAATACITKGGEVYVMHWNLFYKISFPLPRFLDSLEVWRPPSISARPYITKVVASGDEFVALTTRGDVYSWTLDDPHLNTPTSYPGPRPPRPNDVRPVRVWEERRTFTAAKDIAIADGTLLICTRAGHVYTRTRKTELTSVKGFELRGPANVTQASTKKAQYKIARVANLQRVVSVAVSASGGFGAIRQDAPLLPIKDGGQSLEESFRNILPHYRRLDLLKAKDAASRNKANEKTASTPDVIDEEEDGTVEHDVNALTDICTVMRKWDSSWTIPDAGTDILLVAGASGVKIPVHTTILSARSPALAAALGGDKSNGIIFSRIGLDTLLLPDCSHLSALILIHYLYTDTLPAIYDSRVYNKLHSAFPDLNIAASTIKKELQQLSDRLQTPLLSECLRAYSKSIPQPSLSHDLEALLDNETFTDVLLEAEGREFGCQSVVLRARCPFFEAMFDDPDWYALRTEEAENHRQIIRINMNHMRADILEIVLHYIYTDERQNIFAEQTFHKANEYIDFVMMVMAAANELLLDGLKAICSVTIRPLINLHTVCSIFSEAIFYEATSLQKCCMHYMCCNLETMLEQHLLDVLNEEAMLCLGDFCRTRQLDKLPCSRRYIPRLAELRIEYADLWKRLNEPRTKSTMKISKDGGQPRNKSSSVLSPQLSTTPSRPLQTSSVGVAPAGGLSPFSLSRALSPTSPSATLSPSSLPSTIQPPSPALALSPALTESANPSPLVAASNADENSIMFDMDDLQLDDGPMVQAATTSVFTTGNSNTASASSSRLPWQNLPGSSAPTSSLRDIMAQAGNTSQSQPRRTSSTHPQINATHASESPLSPPAKLPQRERKRQQQAALGHLQSTSSPATSSSAAVPSLKPSAAWRPLMPAAWQPPPPDARTERPSLASIQAAQGASSTSSSSMMRTSSGISQVAPHSPSLSTSSTVNSTSRSLPGNAASALGAPVITPTRMAQKRAPSSASGVPETRSHDVAWVNYTTAVVSSSPLASNSTPSSFATIQNLQASEREMLRAQKGPTSLADIQREEDERRQEAAFLAWFNEESQKTQAAAAVDPSPPANRGKARGRGKGRSGRGGESSGRVQGSAPELVDTAASSSSSSSQRGQGRGRGRTQSGAGTPKRQPPSSS